MRSNIIQIWHSLVYAENGSDRYYWHLLDASEQARAEKLKTDLLRRRYVAAHALLRKVLAGFVNQSPEKLRIAQAEHGKPYLTDTPELAFNLSHSGDAVLIAAAWNCRLGVDMEFCKFRTSLDGLVDKCFAEEEIAYWRQLPESEKVEAFYRFWTRKEAFVKATGRGIGLGLNRCVVNPENQTEFLRVPSQYRQVDWHALDIDLGQGACAALVLDKAIGEVRFNEFE